MSWAQDDNPFSAAPAPAPAGAPPPVPQANPTPSNAPDWLSGSNNGVPAPAAAPVAPPVAGDPLPVTQPNAALQPSKPTGPVPAAVKYLRLINLLTSIGVCVLSFVIILGSLGANADMTKAIMCLYVFMFGIMICCFELQVRRSGEERIPLHKEHNKHPVLALTPPPPPPPPFFTT